MPGWWRRAGERCTTRQGGDGVGRAGLGFGTGRWVASMAGRRLAQDGGGSWHRGGRDTRREAGRDTKREAG